MVMSTDNYRVFGTCIMLAMLLAAFAAFAQDELEDFGPAVDTSAVELPTTSSEPDAANPDSTGDASDDRGEISRSTTGNQVMDTITLGRTEVTGNQELPKVMYIVPWQKADPGDLTGKPINSLLDEVLAPIDREEFIRKVDYYGDLYGNED
jgi:hypothetical protein